MSGAALIRDRLRDAGVTLALDADRNLEWQAEADPPADLLAEARRLKPELIALLQAELANDAGSANPGLPADPLRASEHDAVDQAYEVAERLAIAAEEGLPVVSPEAHAAAVRALQRVALPLPGTPLYGARDAYACGRCGRGIWVSPSWPGPAPSLCWACEHGVQS